jgi:hypothetical protein
VQLPQDTERVLQALRLAHRRQNLMLGLMAQLPFKPVS